MQSKVKGTYKLLSAARVALVRTLRCLVFVLLWLLSCSLAFAQTATVIRNVNLRLDSSDEQAAIRLLKPPEKLRLLNTAEEDGYLRVRTEQNQEGWVWARNVSIDAGGFSPAAEGIAAVISETWDRPTPNKSSFTGVSGTCGWAGVGDEKESNQRKNRTDIPTSYHDVNFRALADLPYPVGPKNRSKWSAGDLTEIAKFEGVAIRVVGFLVAVKPQSGSGEATNCRFKLAAETDWHMALVENAGEGEHDAVVVETTPRLRKNHPKWTKSALAPWTDTPQPVRISGWLFFDTEHRNHLKKYRSTLWEIHPITKIEAFKNGKWVNVDDLQP